MKQVLSRRSSWVLLGVAYAAAACRPEGDAGAAARAAASPPIASAAVAAPSDSVAAAFVQAFYTAYTPRAVAGGLAATDSLIAERPALFGPELLAALRRDVAERAHAVGEIAGLDFEPILNSQDPCERYDVGEVARGDMSAGSVQVSVYPVCSGVRASAPAVMAELVPTAAGSWAFLNFRYPGHPPDDLMAILRRLHPKVGAG